MRLSDVVCRQARALIADRLGLDFPAGRQMALEQGLCSAWRTSAVSTPEAYLGRLATLPAESQEWMRLAGHLTVGETYFFRDRASLEALEQHVLPSLIAARRAAGILQLRVWSAGCATGEEPYSLAILLDRLLPDRSDWRLLILATDIHPKALEAAQRGLYRPWSFRETPTWLRKRYFHQRSADTFEVDPRIRQMVTFVRLNLAAESCLAMGANTSTMDVILCRNVLMYFTREAQRATVARLQRTLVPGGWLLVGAAEASAALLRPLVPMHFPGAILYRQEPGSFSCPSCARNWPGFPESAGLWPAPEAGETPALPGTCRADNRKLPQSPVTPPSAEQGRGCARMHADPPCTATDLQRAQVLADQGHLEQARDLCEAVLARDQLDPEAHFLRAAISQERGAIPEALAALRRAIYLAPHSAPAHVLLGSLLLRQGQQRRGRQSLETAMRLLSTVPCDATVPGSGGLTAGRLLEMARAYVEIR